MVEDTPAERKYSVYMALGGAILLSMVDLTANGGIEASFEIVIALITFAGARQAIKSFAGK